MIVLFTDFGWHDPYVGQIKARLTQSAPDVAVIDLLHGVPDFNAHAGAHLLDALAREFQSGSVFLAVVDPGVGGPRGALVVEADGRWYVGPDNGLLTVVAGRAERVRYWRIDWRPERLSASFHGRDLFAPIVGAIAAGAFPFERVTEIAQPEVCFDLADLPRILYLDHYGNAWTGLRGGLLGPDDAIEVKGRHLARRTTFHEAAKGEAFWYVNSVGLVEIAVNRGSAAATLGLAVGNSVGLASGQAGTRAPRH
jgi:S-adenosylmethionine hydrolase